MSVAASRYAKALLDVLYPDKSEVGREQLSRFASMLSQQPDARLLLENPTVPVDRRKDVINKIADSFAMDPHIQNFLALLIDRNRLDLIDEIVATYGSLLDDKLGVVRARVTSALELDSKQRDEVVARLQEVTGKKVRMEVFVDPSLIGGLVAQVGSTIYDGSIRHQLQSFRNNLTQD
jgi:F-type H+-transporting ATPase subunit delta